MDAPRNTRKRKPDEDHGNVDRFEKDENLKVETDNEVVELSDDEDDEVQEPKRKKQKTAAKKKPTKVDGASAIRRVKGKASKLNDLIDMPVDVILTIFEHCALREILNLSRTTKAFRKMLMHRSSAGLWKTAADNVGLPACPADMNLPQFAHLIYTNLCHFCTKSRVLKPDFILRTRICAGCQKTELVDIQTVYNIPQMRSLINNIRSLVPNNHGYSVNKRGWSALKSQLTEVQNKVIGAWFPDQRLVEEPIFTTFKALTTSKDDSPQMTQWQKDTAKLVSDQRTLAMICQEWYGEQNSQKYKEKDALRKERKIAVLNKLRELGWGTEIDNIPAHDSIELKVKRIAEPKPLTERMWSNMQKEVLAYMEQMKVNRLARERVALVKSRRAPAMTFLNRYKNTLLPFNKLLPGPCDFFAFAEVEAIMNRPSEDTVDDSSFDFLVPLLPPLFEAWKETVHAKFITSVRESAIASSMGYNYSPYDYDNDEGNLYGFNGGASRPTQSAIVKSTNAVTNARLAVTVYRCDCSPGAPLFYPLVLAHSCCTATRRPTPSIYELAYGLSRFNTSDPLLAMAKDEQYLYTRRPWTPISCDNHTYLTLPYLGDVTKKVIESCGGDPGSATAEDMDLLDARVACLACAEWAEDQTTKDESKDAEDGKKDAEDEKKDAEDDKKDDVAVDFKGKGKAKEVDQDVEMEDGEGKGREKKKEREAEDVKVQIFTWRSAVNHISHCHSTFSQSLPSWHLLTSDELVLAKDHELQMAEKVYTEEEYVKEDREPMEKIYVCALCRDTPDEVLPKNKFMISRHLSIKHEITDAEINVHYHKDFAALELFDNEGRSSKITIHAVKPKDVAKTRKDIALARILPSYPPLYPYGHMMDMMGGMFGDFTDEDDSESYDSDGFPY